jgi:trans-aconitate methyltransferase
MTESKKNSDILWDANDYHELSFAQKAAALPLLQRLKISMNDAILDVGCGNGWITANIARMAKTGIVLGIDQSPEMLRFATKNFSKKNYPNLELKLSDGQDFISENTFDVIFSSFALQWFKKKDTFIKNCHKSLKNQGRLCFTIPLSISPELQESVDYIISRSEFKEYFLNFEPNWFFEKPETFNSLITDNNFQITYFSTCTQEVIFPSRELLEKYILLWFPYLKPLPEHLRQECFRQIMNQYFEMLPIQIDKSVIIRIPRVDIIAVKVI